MITFSKALSDAMEERGESVKDVASFLGIHTNAVYQYRLGKMIPRPDRFIKICNHFGIPISSLKEDFIFSRKREFNAEKAALEKDLVDRTIVDLEADGCSLYQICKITGKREKYVLDILGLLEENND